MFKNYFKAGIRNVLKYKAFSFINIFGLALAMSVGMLIHRGLLDIVSIIGFIAFISISIACFGLLVWRLILQSGKGKRSASARC